MRWYHLYDKCVITESGYVDTTDIHPTRVLGEWVLVFVLEGERTFRVFSEDYAVHGNEYFLLPPQTPHCGIKEDRHRALYVHFKMNGTEIDTPKIIDSVQIVFPMHGRIPAELNCVSVMNYLVQHRFSPFLGTEFSSVQMQALLCQLSVDAQIREIWKKQESTSAFEIFKYINDHKSEHLTNEDYERVFGKSYRQLNDIFKRVYKTTIRQMLITLRIGSAKNFLYTGYTISQTCSKCGFDDYLYFLKVFKAKTGMTPTEFIKQKQ